MNGTYSKRGSAVKKQVLLGSVGIAMLLAGAPALAADAGLHDKIDLIVARHVHEHVGDEVAAAGRKDGLRADGRVRGLVGRRWRDAARWRPGQTLETQNVIAAHAEREGDYGVGIPPLTLRVSPVTYPDSAEDRYTYAPAISAG